MRDKCSGSGRAPLRRERVPEPRRRVVLRTSVTTYVTIGNCQVCGGWFQVTANGYMRPHVNLVMRTGRRALDNGSS